MGVGVSWVMGFVYLGLVIPHSIAIKTAQIFVGNSDYGDITDITRYYGITRYFGITIYIYRGISQTQTLVFISSPKRAQARPV
jgi:hypothetical protein